MSYETKKRSARMRTRAKQKHVASDRARRENVPRHILFHAVKFIIHPVLCKISNSENTVCKSELFVIYFPIFFSVAYFLIP